MGHLLEAANPSATLFPALESPGRRQRYGNIAGAKWLCLLAQRHYFGDLLRHHLPILTGGPNTPAGGSPMACSRGGDHHHHVIAQSLPMRCLRSCQAGAVPPGAPASRRELHYIYNLAEDAESVELYDAVLEIDADGEWNWRRTGHGTSAEPT